MSANPEREYHWTAHLGDNTAPGDYLRINFLASLLLMVHNCLEQTVQALIDTIIVLDELLKALG